MADGRRHGRCGMRGAGDAADASARYSDSSPRGHATPRAVALDPAERFAGRERIAGCERSGRAARRGTGSVLSCVRAVSRGDVARSDGRTARRHRARRRGRAPTDSARQRQRAEHDASDRRAHAARVFDGRPDRVPPVDPSRGRPARELSQREHARGSLSSPLSRRRAPPREARF